MTPTSTRTSVLRLGTRRSALAVVQAELVASALRALGHQVELIGVTTEGDRSAEVGEPLVEAGGVGVFVAELRSRLLAGDVDLVVHSMKDLPTGAHPGLTVAAIPTREDPRDALVARDRLTLAQLPVAAVVGTGSPRRAAQLRARRDDLDVRSIRGNVDTRLGKVAAGEFDAVVLATAGLSRLGRLGEASEVFDPDVMLPAPGQGALAIECRNEASQQLVEALAGLDDQVSRAAVVAERAVLAALEAGCTEPVGAYAVVSGLPQGGASGGLPPGGVLGGQLPPGLVLSLTAAVVSVDGTTTIKRSAATSLQSMEGAYQLGRDVAAELLGAGASGVMGKRP